MNINAYSILEFCERFSIGRSKVYEEISSGRLVAHKLGRRTLITNTDAEAWLISLPRAVSSAADTESIDETSSSETEAVG